LESPTVIAKLREAFPDLPEKPDRRTVFLKLRELRNEWSFRVGRRGMTIPITCAIVCNEIDSTLNACATGLGLGLFLSYQTAPYRKSNKIRYVLQEFETEPVPVQIIYPHTRRLS